MATAKRLEEFECPICAEKYKDPRVIPCGHTFCRPCIEALRTLRCPLCRQRITLPGNGVGDLPKNYFIVNFLQELSRVESACEVCSGEQRVATVFCIECQQKLCQACEKCHKKFNMTRRHKTVELYPSGDSGEHNGEYVKASGTPNDENCLACGNGEAITTRPTTNRGNTNSFIPLTETSSTMEQSFTSSPSIDTGETNGSSAAATSRARDSEMTGSLASEAGEHHPSASDNPSSSPIHNVTPKLSFIQKLRRRFAKSGKLDKVFAKRHSLRSL